MADAAIMHALQAESLRGPVACVDLETTGGLSGQHRVIEVGIVLLDHGAVVEEWCTLVNPGVRIPPAIAAFTGIDDSMVEGAPSFADVCSEVHRRLAGRLFVAHNVRFDYGFLRAEFRRAGLRFSAPALCTVRLSRALYPEHARHNLDTLIERFALGCTARHRALGDAQVLPALLAAMERDHGGAALQAAIVEALREPRLPPQLPAELADELPDAPGVYLFKGEEGALLYVGKSRNIRSRVFDHLNAGHRSGKETRLTRMVRSVEWIETGGELGALLLESRLVKELSPTANRRLRRSEAGFVLRLEATAEGLAPRVASLDDAGDEDEPRYGPFRGEQDAWRALEGKAREARLCLKVLGRESGPGSCFGWQVGRCRGACVGKEPRALHDARLQMALASLRLKPWPFPGPVGIREPAPGARGHCVHVIDRWQHIGTAHDESEIEQVLRGVRAERFDADSYHIIGRALRDVRPRDLVVLTPRQDA
jgi:DNA polymerase-3 subunit epsilon